MTITFIESKIFFVYYFLDDASQHQRFAIGVVEMSTSPSVMSEYNLDDQRQHGLLW